MEASSSQFEYLQNFVKGQGSIKEVDRILDSVIKQSGYPAAYYVAEISYYFKILLELLIQCALVMKEHVRINNIYIYGFSFIFKV